MPKSPAPILFDKQPDGAQFRPAEIWLRISAFLEQRSLNTQRTYVGIVKEWVHFLSSGRAEAGSEEAALMLRGATDLHAARYRSWLERQPGQAPRLNSTAAAGRSVRKAAVGGPRRDGLQNTLSNATIAKKLAALRRIYRMLSAAGLGINENPFDVDRLPPPSGAAGQKRPTEMIPFELVQEILMLPDRTTSKGLRDAALLSALFGGGLRRSEAARLRIGDVRRTASGTCYLRLRATKAKTDADQALPEWAAEVVGRLVQERRAAGGLPGDYLFLSYRGPGGTVPSRHHISESGIYRVFKKYCQLAGAADSASPHSARATAITKLLDSGLSHREVKEFSRHSSVQMVEVYDKRRSGVDGNPAKDLKF